MRPTAALFLTGFLSLHAPAGAADPLAPVREVMDLTVANWSEEEEEWRGVFEGSRLDRLFTREIASLYRQASEKAAEDYGSDEPVDPFDYDVVTNSQEGCPLQDVKLAPAVEKDGVFDVAVTFRLWVCEDLEETRNLVTQVHFEVVEEGGRPVIRDIRHPLESGSDSVLTGLRAILESE